MEHKERSVPQLPHQLILQDRHQLELTGVSDVDSFDENTVIAYTTMGELTIRGSGLHINQMNLECGSMSLQGQVDTLSYSDVQRGGFFRRLLR